MTAAETPMPQQVLQVRKQIKERFQGIVDDSDIAHFSGNNYEQRFLSRGLAALAVRRLARCTHAEAARLVTDGIADQGLDAIAPMSQSGQLLLVQAKWSDMGTAAFDLNAAKAMVDGLNRIERELYSQFNDRAKILAEQARPLLIDGKTTLVIALMGTAVPDKPAKDVLDNALAEFNSHGDRMRVKVLLARDFHDQIHADLKPEPVRLRVRLDDWYNQRGDVEAYQGTVSVESIAEWYEVHGSDLFEQNLRAPLGVTVANAEIGHTLTTNPTSFWYLNNGITMICDELKPNHESAKSPRSRPTTLEVSGASIVNGAQTVMAISRAMYEDGESAANATVSIKVINTRGDKDLGVRVSKATNRQNAIEARDHIALEPVHQSIKANLRAELGKQYVIKRGEPVPAPETGCSLDELAMALACLHIDAKHAARVASSMENLWEQGESGSHTLLFGREPSPYKVWRSVQTLRVTRSAVYGLEAKLKGREATVAEHGAFLMAHLIFRHLDASSIDDVDFDWEVEILEKIPPLVPEFVRRLTHATLELKGSRAQVRAAFQSAEDCQRIADKVLVETAQGFAIPELPAKKRKPRRQNTVPLLVDRRVLKDGVPLHFQAQSEPERVALEGWLAEEEKRAQATWVNHRTKPVLWSYDQQRYSPTGLVAKIWWEAAWEERPVSNQGTARWFQADGRSLVDLANEIYDTESSEAFE